jgi:hypothetical protein
MNRHFTTFVALVDGLAHACDPTASFDAAVDAYAEARDDNYPAEVFLIDLDKGTATKHTDRANRRVIKRCRDRGQELPEWLA